MKRLLAVGALTLALSTTLASTLAGCGTSTDPDTAGDDVRTSEPAGIAYPHGATDVLLQVSTGGGYTTLEYAQTLRPSITIYGDGTVIAEPEGAEDGLNTRMLRLRAAHIDDTTVQQVLTLARDAGLLADPPDYDMAGGMMVTDNPTTTVTLRTDAGTFTHAAYALGFAAGDDSGDGDTEARRTLRTFIADATRVATDTARFEAYTPARIRLYVTDDGAGRRGTAWPADAGVDLAPGCHDVTPEQAATLGELLGEADMGTRFVQGKRVYSVIGVQMLPGERCSAGR